MNPDVDVVCKFRPQVRVFLNVAGEASIEVTGYSSDDVVVIPLDCAKQVAKAIAAIAKECA